MTSNVIQQLLLISFSMLMQILRGSIIFFNWSKMTDKNQRKDCFQIALEIQVNFKYNFVMFLEGTELTCLNSTKFK